MSVVFAARDGDADGARECAGLLSCGTGSMNVVFTALDCEVDIEGRLLEPLPPLSLLLGRRAALIVRILELLDGGRLLPASPASNRAALIWRRIVLGPPFGI